MLTQEISVVVVDDHKLMVVGLCAVIKGAKGMNVRGAVGSVVEALELLEIKRPDIVIVDLMLKGRLGFELIPEVKRRGGVSLVYTASETWQDAFRALKLGASGFITKDDKEVDIIKAIRTVVQTGRKVLSKEIENRLTDYVIRVIGNPQLEDPVLSLTIREYETFYLAANGWTTKKIAKEFVLSPKTIETYIRNGRTKLKLREKTEYVAYAGRWVKENNLTLRPPPDDFR